MTSTTCWSRLARRAAPVVLLVSGLGAHAGLAHEVIAIPPDLRAGWSLDRFYQKCVVTGEFPVVSSAAVSDFALLEAADLIDRLLSGREPLRAALVEEKVRFAVMAHGEFTTQIPEHRDLSPAAYWDRRARGLGATRTRPAVSCGEENLLGLPGDPYLAENILIHEFAHAIHEMALDRVDPGFDARLRECHARALREGLWLGTYASENHREYWAEGVQSWFGTNREHDLEHNHVNTRPELKAYDPRLAGLIEGVFGDEDWQYVHPSMRGAPAHLRGLDAPAIGSFHWPPALVDLPASRAPELLPADLPALAPLPVVDPPTPSRPSVEATRIYFVNESDDPVHLFWLDPEGVRHSYGRILPHSHRSVATYVGHSWVLVDRQDQVLQRYQAAKGSVWGAHWGTP